MSIAIHRVIVASMATLAAAFLLFSFARADQVLAHRVFRDISSVVGISNGQIVDDETITFMVGALQARINLGNLRAELADASTKEHVAIYRRFVAAYRLSLSETVRGERPVDPDKLYLIVRNQDFLAATDSRLEGLTGQSISQDLVILLAAYEKPLIKTVGETGLAGTGLTFAAAIQRAQVNLDRRVNSVRVRGVSREHFIWAAALDEDFASSLILSERFLQKAVVTAGGPVILGVPERGLLYFAPANDLQAVSILENLVRRMHGEAIGNLQLSSTILYSDGGPVRLR
jgi:hypothetical protein